MCKLENIKKCKQIITILLVKYFIKKKHKHIVISFFPRKCMKREEK